MSRFYDLLNGWADKIGLAVTFDSPKDVVVVVVPVLVVGWFFMHLIFDD